MVNIILFTVGRHSRAHQTPPLAAPGSGYGSSMVFTNKYSSGSVLQYSIEYDGPSLFIPEPLPIPSLPFHRSWRSLSLPVVRTSYSLTAFSNSRVDTVGRCRSFSNPSIHSFILHEIYSIRISLPKFRICQKLVVWFPTSRKRRMVDSPGTALSRLQPGGRS
ncbi:hypothetical protein Mapa_002944 [Marchantia paleacea]|nr:hypothetical protein Mapa_002944 [Marchantia paleacea]